ncbi:hypothetical protein DPMN_114696 [Dreissena polymorpha]|uniref:Uncharacterized protein n=1 Tax=Dreissena polymorpha TaxID=45954 RepID=A0A9D4KJZ2_DREPO|nr:hypothetical protein DPMN_114696 [Dreissena polymorpha]
MFFYLKFKFAQSLVSFVPLFVEDKESMLRVMKAVDKANCYVFGDLEDRNMQQMLSCAVGAEFEYEKIKTVQERFVDMEETESEKG